jgi:hydrogenase nickel incorporation protein HypA/HybF
MHEYHAVEAVVERLTSAGLRGLTEVRIQAGPTFSPEALQQAYTMLTQDTPLAGSRLVVVELPDERGCSACGRGWTVTRDDVAGHAVLCPSCGSPSPSDGGASIEVLGISP